MSSLRSKTLALLSSKSAALPIEIPEIKNEDGRTLVLYLIPPSVAQIMQLQAAVDPKLPEADRAKGMEEVSSALLAKLVISDPEDDASPLFESATELRKLDMRIFARLSWALMSLMQEGTKIMVGSSADEAAKTSKIDAKSAPAEVTKGEGTDEPGNASSGA